MKQPIDWSQYKLPLSIAGAFIIAALWVGAGRLLFGVFGWMAFISLFLLAPIILVYGVTLAIIVGVRMRNVSYSSTGPFMILLYVTLASLFVLGLSIPDAGDTPESGGSALTVLMGDKSGEAELAVSGAVAGWAILGTIIGAACALVAAFMEKTKMSNRKKPSDTLKKIT